MPRKPREISPTGIYHIIFRSINQHIIFEEDSDYKKFLLILSDCKTKYNIDIYAYCLMDNHIHILIYSPPEKLSSFCQSLGTRFVRWYNTKYSRIGHLFQERFHSVCIEGTMRFLSTMIYIHQNPVKANICHDQSEYRWSSFGAYFNRLDPIVNTAYLNQIAEDNYTSKTLLLSPDTIPKCPQHTDIPFETKHFISDKKAIEIFKEITHLSSASDSSHLSKAQRNEYILLLRNNRLTEKQISRLMDISISQVKRICQTCRREAIFAQRSKK